MEQLDCLLNGIKKGDIKAKEQKIAQIGQKYNLNLVEGGDSDGGYGKKKQLEQKPFEYQQPFNMKEGAVETKKDTKKQKVKDAPPSYQ